MIELEPANETLDLPLTLGKLSFLLSYKMGHQDRDTLQELAKGKCPIAASLC